MAISDFTHAQGLNFSTVRSERLIKIIFLSRCEGIEYKPPNRKYIGTDLLAINYKRNTDTMNILLRRLILKKKGNGATMKKLHLSILLD